MEYMNDIPKIYETKRGYEVFCGAVWYGTFKEYRMALDRLEVVKRIIVQREERTP